MTIAPLTDPTADVWICHDGDYLPVSAASVPEHLALGDVLGECPVPHVPLPRTEACLMEDGSSPGQSFPCYWDGSVDGNGQGLSFTLTEAGGVPAYVEVVEPVVNPVNAPAVEPAVEPAVLICPAGTWANDALTGCEPLPVQPVAQVQVPASPPAELAHTGMDPMGALVASVLVAVGALCLIGRRRLV
jgi:hypothetical protein